MSVGKNILVYWDHLASSPELFGVLTVQNIRDSVKKLMKTDAGVKPVQDNENESYLGSF